MGKYSFWRHFWDFSRDSRVAPLTLIVRLIKTNAQKRASSTSLFKLVYRTGTSTTGTGVPIVVNTKYYILILTTVMSRGATHAASSAAGPPYAASAASLSDDDSGDFVLLRAPSSLVKSAKKKAYVDRRAPEWSCIHITAAGNFLTPTPSRLSLTPSFEL